MKSSAEGLVSPDEAMSSQHLQADLNRLLEQGVLPTVRLGMTRRYQDGHARSCRTVGPGAGGSAA